MTKEMDVFGKQKKIYLDEYGCLKSGMTREEKDALVQAYKDTQARLDTGEITEQEFYEEIYDVKLTAEQWESVKARGFNSDGLMGTEAMIRHYSY